MKWWQPVVLAACLTACGWAVVNGVKFYSSSQIQAYQIAEMHDNLKLKECK